LQADQARIEYPAEDFCDLGFADPGLTFEKERPAELQSEEDGRT
jgi:hypothetical protein